MERKVAQDKRITTKDALHETLQFDDTVTVTDRNSKYVGYTGIIKAISKQVLFLWDQKLMFRSFGIYAENSRCVEINGKQLFS